MSAEENKALFLKFFDDVWAGRYEDPDDPGYRPWIDEIRAAFPDLTVIADQVLAAEGDHVVIMFTGTGTHQGDFLGIPASGEPVTFRGTTVARLENGKIVDEFACTEKMGSVMLRQTL